MTVRIMSLDFRYKNDFPYLWNAVPYGVKASKHKQGTATLTSVWIKSVRKTPCHGARVSVSDGFYTEADWSEACRVAANAPHWKPECPLQHWQLPGRQEGKMKSTVLRLHMGTAVTRGWGLCFPLHVARIPDSSLLTVLFTLLGRECHFLFFSPVFKCSNSSHQMCLLVSFVRHQLLNSAIFPPLNCHSLCP